MYFLIYSSNAAFEFNQEDLKALLLQAQIKNKGLDVTGMLIYSGGLFIQLIEGREDVIKPLYAQICTDKRHTDVLVLKEGNISTRFFKEWSMGFRALLPEDLDAIEGFKDMYAAGGFNLVAALHLFEIFAKEDVV